jgi:hypothetical protein
MEHYLIAMIGSTAMSVQRCRCAHMDKHNLVEKDYCRITVD